MSNITHITGLNTSLSYHTRSHVQSHGNAIDPANNLGYGIGRIARRAFDHLWHSWQKMWAVEPTSEELVLHKQSMIFRNGLRECVQRLGAALDDVRKNPHDSGALKKIESLAEHYALYFKFQERPELRAFQHKTLQPLEEKISQLTDPQIKNMLRQLLVVVFQEKSSVEEIPVAKNIGPLSHADSRIAKTKRAVQQTGVFPASFDLSTLMGTDGFKVEGLAAGDYLGISVSTAGDVNGDGKADLVLGAHNTDPGGRTNAGTAYILFGQMNGWLPSFNLATLNGANGFKIEGLAAGDGLGVSVSTAGDLNGDGKADLVLGAYQTDPGGRSQAGTAYVVFGQASGWPGALNLMTLNGTNGFKVEGLAAGDNLGYSVSTAGDVNGDGKADFVVGAPVTSPGGRNLAGTAYVVFGQASGWPGALNLATLNGTKGFKVDGLVAGDYLGNSVSTAGDLNGDGNADLVLGARYASPGGRSRAGTTYVLFGQVSGWPGALNLAALNGTNGFKVEGLAAGDNLGSGETAEDLNGDGNADLVLGAYNVSSVGRAQAGTVYVVLGQAGGWPRAFDLTTLNGTNGFKVEGLTAGDALGISVSTAGDIDGDGLFDLLLGAPTSPDGTAYVIFGRNTSLTTSTPSPIQTPLSINPVTIEVKIPLNLNATFIPVTVDILSISNNTITVSLIDGQGYAIVFTSNYSAVPLSTPFSPLDVTGFSIALGNGSTSKPPVFEGCNAVGQCVLSNTTTPLQQTVAIEGVDWKLVVPIVLGVAAVAVGGGLVFYFAYYRKLKRHQSDHSGPSVKLERRMKK